MDIKRTTTFILGAGFSVKQQFPLMKGLKDRVIHFLEAEQHDSYADDIRRDGSDPSGQFYEGLAYIDPEKNLGFEELLIKLSDHLKSTRTFDPCYVTNQVLRIGVARLFWCITFFIWRVEGCYRNFARSLMKSEGAWKVVNFNWDILIEKSLSEVGALWTYSLSPNNSAIPIIKPHGSINWSSFAHNQNISPQYSGWKPIGVGSTLSYDKCHPLGNPDLDENNPDCRYCLYPGDPDQPQSHADLKRIWKDIRAGIQSSEKVIYIGYSLPEYDSYARSALQEFCKDKVVEVYDPSLKTLDRFSVAFPNAKLERLDFQSTPYALCR